jgi:hypothetical protein
MSKLGTVKVARGGDNLSNLHRPIKEIYESRRSLKLTHERDQIEATITQNHPIQLQLLVLCSAKDNSDLWSR